VELGDSNAMIVTFQSILQVSLTLNLINIDLPLQGINVDHVENLSVKDLHHHTKKFPLENAGVKIDLLPHEEQPARVSHLLSLKSLCETGMQNTPVDQWLSSWQQTADACNGEISIVSNEEIDRITTMINKSNEDFKASLICECSGRLSREFSIFCPDCKSHNMTYRMSAIT
jgi:hypothetical protein